MVPVTSTRSLDDVRQLRILTVVTGLVTLALLFTVLNGPPKEDGPETIVPLSPPPADVKSSGRACPGAREGLTPLVLAPTPGAGDVVPRSAAARRQPRGQDGEHWRLDITLTRPLPAGQKLLVVWQSGVAEEPAGGTWEPLPVKADGACYRVTQDVVRPLSSAPVPVRFYLLPPDSCKGLEPGDDPLSAAKLADCGALPLASSTLPPPA